MAFQKQRFGDISHGFILNIIYSIHKNIAWQITFSLFNVLSRTLQDADAHRRADLAAGELEKVKLELKKESIMRKKAYNELRELKGNIRVIARIRPPLVAGVAEGAARKIALEVTD